ncbi:titin-like [Anneissia japonica]|uniref:titin-like n=1 Tax=Anneissia japonica TaxID=1529436 RepID=UPI0014256C0A|nr:titin-like [Anneissia japonica]
MIMTSLEAFFALLMFVICRLDGWEIIKHPNSYNVSEGDSVKFACRFDSSIRGHIYRLIWYRKGEAVTAFDLVRPSLETRFAVSQDEFNYNLSISAVLYEDTGIYYCVADNRTMKSRSNEAQLDVSPAPDPLCYIQRVINNTKYVCTSSTKGDVIYWTYNNEPILQLEVAEDDTRTLRCNVKNSLGIPNRTCVINNHCVVRHVLDGLVVIGDKAAFICTCRYPHFWNVTSWTYNYNKISISSGRFFVSGESLHIDFIQEKDNGLLIRCNAKNETNEVSSGWLKLQTSSGNPTSTVHDIDPVSFTAAASDVWTSTMKGINPSSKNDFRPISKDILKYIALVLMILICVITVCGVVYCTIKRRAKRGQFSISLKDVIKHQNTESFSDNATKCSTPAATIKYSNGNQSSDHYTNLSTINEDSEMKINECSDEVVIYANVEETVIDCLEASFDENEFDDDWGDISNN